MSLKMEMNTDVCEKVFINDKNIIVRLKHHYFNQLMYSVIYIQYIRKEEPDKNRIYKTWS